MARAFSKRNVTHKVPKTLEEAYEGMRRRVEYLACLYSSSHPVIKEDLVQAGRMAVEKALKRYRPNDRAGFWTYCSKVVKNAMVDMKKMESRRCLTAEQVIDIGDRLHQRSLENREMHQKMCEVMEAAKHLDPAQQQVIEKSRMGYSIGEIAHDLGLSERQTMRIRDAAIVKLQAYLIPHPRWTDVGDEKESTLPRQKMPS